MINRIGDFAQSQRMTSELLQTQVRTRYRQTRGASYMRANACFSICDGFAINRQLFAHPAQSTCSIVRAYQLANEATFASRSGEKRP